MGWLLEHEADAARDVFRLQGIPNIGAVLGVDFPVVVQFGQDQARLDAAHQDVRTCQFYAQGFGQSFDEIRRWESIPNFPNGRANSPCYRYTDIARDFYDRYWSVMVEGGEPPVYVSTSLGQEPTGSER